MLAGDLGGWRLGLGVLQHHGVVAWLRAWDSLPAPPPATQPSGLPAPPMYLAARRSNAGGNRISAGLPACSGTASAVICPSPDSVCA